MRKVNFKVRNIGSEKYLSYVLDDETDFDEELLDRQFIRTSMGPYKLSVFML